MLLQDGVNENGARGAWGQGQGKGKDHDQDQGQDGRQSTLT
jgi:hypothetical protein